MSDLLWWVFASLAVGGAAGTVLGRNPIASLLSLVLTFFSLAAIYILLGAHFIGAIQVMVYAGAIMVLFLFVIMLLNLGHDFRADLRKGAWLVSGFTATGLIFYFLWRPLAEPNGLAAAGAPVADKAAEAGNAVTVIADPLFREFLVPFELTSILLLVAVIGAVLLAKRRV
ncbi:MAG TPA: NADH-quinone oxidoreductase subunit J [Longimicrobiales bacterium]